MDSLGIGKELEIQPLEEKQRFLKIAKKINNQKTYLCESCNKRKSVIDSYFWVSEDEGGIARVSCGSCTLDGMLNNLLIMNTEELQERIEEDMEEKE